MIYKIRKIFFIFTCRPVNSKENSAGRVQEQNLLYVTDCFKTVLKQYGIDKMICNRKAKQKENTRKYPHIIQYMVNIHFIKERGLNK